MIEARLAELIRMVGVNASTLLDIYLVLFEDFLVKNWITPNVIVHRILCMWVISFQICLSYFCVFKYTQNIRPHSGHEIISVSINGN